MSNLQDSPICVSSGEDADDEVFETIRFKFNEHNDDDKVTYVIGPQRSGRGPLIILAKTSFDFARQQ